MRSFNNGTLSLHSTNLQVPKCLEGNERTKYCLAFPAAGVAARNCTALTISLTITITKLRRRNLHTYVLYRTCHMTNMQFAPSGSKLVSSAKDFLSEFPSILKVMCVPRRNTYITTWQAGHRGFVELMIAPCGGNLSRNLVANPKP